MISAVVSVDADAASAGRCQATASKLRAAATAYLAIDFIEALPAVVNHGKENKSWTTVSSDFVHLLSSFAFLPRLRPRGTSGGGGPARSGVRECRILRSKMVAGG